MSCVTEQKRPTDGSQEPEIMAIQHSLNDRPRATLGFMKPSEKLAEILALTA